MATVNLGRIKPVFRGAYSGSTAYVVDDIVTHGNESFICIQAHGAGTQATSQTAYWTKLAAKGADGTDVGTTLTTQGDILYRDGSGLQRLAKGTANQTLQMNGSADAPTWVTADSGTLVKIADLSHSSNVTSFDMTNCFSATYDLYKLYVTDLHGSTNNKEFSIRFLDSGGNSVDANYSACVYGYVQTNGNNGGHGHFSQDSDNRIRFIGENYDSPANEPTNLECTFYSPYQSQHTTTAYNYLIRASNNYYYNCYGANQTRSDTSIRSLRFFGNGGDQIAGYRATMYGVKR